MNNSEQNSEKKKFLNIPKIGAQSCGCILLAVIVACCGISVFLVVVKPQFIWDRVVTFINDDSNYQNLQPQPQSQNIQQEITSQITKVGENDVYISQDQLTLLLRDKFPQLKDITADIEDGEVRVFWKLDNTSNPILGEGVLKIDDQSNLKVVQLGTPRLFFPEFMYTAVNNLVYKFFSQDIVNTGFGVFSTNDNVKLEQMKFLKGQVYLKILIDVKLF